MKLAAVVPGSMSFVAAFTLLICLWLLQRKRGRAADFYAIGVWLNVGPMFAAAATALYFVEPQHEAGCIAQAVLMELSTSSTAFATPFLFELYVMLVRHDEPSSRRMRVYTACVAAYMAVRMALLLALDGFGPTIAAPDARFVFCYIKKSKTTLKFVFGFVPGFIQTYVRFIICDPASCFACA